MIQDLTLEELAVRAAKEAGSHEKIVSCSGYWIPLALLYDSLKKEITLLKKLPEEQKRKYWRNVRHFDKDDYVKILMCQALYVFDLIKN